VDSFEVVALEIEESLILTVHPSEPFTRNQLEINALISVFGVNHVGEFHSIKLNNKYASEVRLDNRHRK